MACATKRTFPHDVTEKVTLDGTLPEAIGDVTMMAMEHSRFKPGVPDCVATYSARVKRSA